MADPAYTLSIIDDKMDGANSGVDRDGYLTFTRVMLYHFEIVGSSSGMKLEFVTRAILNDYNTPLYGSVFFQGDLPTNYQTNPIVTSISMAPEGDNRNFKVTVSYSNRKDESSQKEDTADQDQNKEIRYPWQKPTEWNVATAEGEGQVRAMSIFEGFGDYASVVGDLTDSPIGASTGISTPTSTTHRSWINSAGDPLENPPQIPTQEAELSCSFAIREDATDEISVFWKKNILPIDSTLTIHNTTGTLRIADNQGEAVLITIKAGTLMFSGLSTNSNEFVDSRSWLKGTLHPFGITTGGIKAYPRNNTTNAIPVVRYLRYFQFRLTFKLCSNGFKSYILDQGYNEVQDDNTTGVPVNPDGSLDTTGITLYAITGKDGQEVSKPAKLNGKGKALAVAGSEITNAWYLKFAPYAYADMAYMLNKIPVREANPLTSPTEDESGW